MNLSKVYLYTKNIVVDGEVIPVYYDKSHPDDERLWQEVSVVLTVIYGFSQWLGKKGYKSLTSIWNNFTLIPVYDWVKVGESDGMNITTYSTASTWRGVIYVNPNFLINVLLYGDDFFGTNIANEESDNMKYPLRRAFIESGMEWTENTGRLCVFYVLLHEIFHNIHGHIFDWEQLHPDRNDTKGDELYDDKSTANKAMDYSCNYSVEFFFPELRGFGDILGLYSDPIMGQDGWMNNYDRLVDDTVVETTDDYLDGYNSMCDEISGIIKDVYDEYEDKNELYEYIIEEFRDTFDSVGIDIDEVISEIITESVSFKWGSKTYNEGSIDAFKNWMQYLKNKIENDKKTEMESEQFGNQRTKEQSNDIDDDLGNQQLDGLSDNQRDDIDYTEYNKWYKQGWDEEMAIQ